MTETMESASPTACSTTLANLQPLVDGDILLYRCGFAADSQVKKQLKQQDPSLTDGDLAHLLEEMDYKNIALHNAKQVLVHVAELFDGSSMRVFLTGDGNFREQIATLLPYKGNRDPTHKPKYYKEIKQYLIEVWGAEIVHGQEADDALGIAQYERNDESTVIVSVDKDLDMIPGHHYNFVRKEYYYISQQYADTRLFWQMLVGDTTDNIPGINGIGDKRADKIVAQCKGDVDALRYVVKEKYRDQYGAFWEDAYNEVGNLLWIRREAEQDCPLL